MRAPPICLCRGGVTGVIFVPFAGEDTGVAGDCLIPILIVGLGALDAGCEHRNVPQL